MRGIFAVVLIAAGCTLETNTLDTRPSLQAGGTGGFDSGVDASGGQAGSVATGGLSGSAGASGAAGLAGAAGGPADAGSDVQVEAEADSGEDAAPDGGTDAGEDSASDAAGDVVDLDAPNQSTCNQPYLDLVWMACKTQHPFTIGGSGNPMNRACSGGTYQGDPVCGPKCQPTGFCTDQTIATQVCGGCMVSLHSNFPQYLNHPFVDCLAADVCF